MQQEDGVTLLELILVITILSIILALGFPLIKRKIKTADFKLVVNKTYLVLDYAKTHSTLKNIILEITFDTEKNRIVLSEKAKKDEEVLDIINIPKNIHLKAEKEKILFYPDGTLQEFEVVVFDDEERRSKITSRGFDGVIAVKPLDNK